MISLPTSTKLFVSVYFKKNSKLNFKTHSNEDSGVLRYYFIFVYIPDFFKMWPLPSSIFFKIKLWMPQLHKMIDGGV